MQKSLQVLILVILYKHGSCILTNMACSTSGKGTCIDPYCFITPYNKTTNSANFGCGRLSRPVYKVYVRQQLYFKFFSIYIPFNFFPVIEWCSFVVNPNPLSYFNGILNVLKEKVPKFVKRCPYSGRDMQINNLTLVQSDLALWIVGEYKVVYTFFDDNDSKMYQVTGRGTINRH